MIQLNPQNYFDLNNRVLTRSKIKDFAIDKNYFYRKHVLGTVPPRPKKAFLIGSLVDELITLLDSKNKYAVVSGDGRTKAVKEERALMESQGYTVVSESEYDLIFNVAGAVEETDVYKALISEGYIKQGILQYEMPIGEHFDGIASMIDFYKIDGNKCTIVDLKTAADISPERYHYHAMDYWYYHQMAMNIKLFRLCHPSVEIFSCYNLVVDKKEDIYSTNLFELSQERIGIAMNDIDVFIEALKEEKEFKKYNPSFDKAVLIGSMWDED